MMRIADLPIRAEDGRLHKRQAGQFEGIPPDIISIEYEAVPVLGLHTTGCHCMIAVAVHFHYLIFHIQFDDFAVICLDVPSSVLVGKPVEDRIIDGRLVRRIGLRIFCHVDHIVPIG